MSPIHEESNPQQDEQVSSISMDEWFRQATAEECDNMSALQLGKLMIVTTNNNHQPSTINPSLTLP
jgi:hypothetical protein